MKLNYKILLLILINFSLTSCGVYSFTGVNTIAETIYVGNFVNRASGGPPNLGQDFTESLKSYYIQNSSLDLVSLESQGELIVEGEIIAYDVTPLAPTANDVAAQNLLKMVVNVRFINTLEESKSFEQQFSQDFNFPQNQTLSQVESEAIDFIFEQITFNIFNKTLSDW